MTLQTLSTLHDDVNRSRPKTNEEMRNFDQTQPRT